jgi:hypothetical protein
LGLLATFRPCRESGRGEDDWPLQRIENTDIRLEDKLAELDRDLE